MADSLHIQHIAQVSITVHDVEKTCAFYNHVLGLHTIYQTPNMALLDCQGIRLILSIPETTEFDHPSSIIYYKVDDIQQAYQTLIANGVTLIGQPHVVGTMGNSEFWMAFFRDPDQNVLAITSETLINKDEI